MTSVLIAYALGAVVFYFILRPGPGYARRLRRDLRRNVYFKYDDPGLS